MTASKLDKIKSEATGKALGVSIRRFEKNQENPGGTAKA
jgi:hypothetical protein